MRIQETPELQQVAVKIQRAWRCFLCRKHAAIAFPEEYTCPITCLIFQQPVIAGDGNTYEWDAIRRYLNGHPPPCRGPLGTEIRASILYPNRALINILDEFRTSHRMAAMRPFHVEPAHAPTTPAPIQRVQHHYLTPRDVVSQGLSVEALMVHPAFLERMQNTGLNMILLNLTGNQRLGATQHQLVDAVTRSSLRNREGEAGFTPLKKMILDTRFLSYVHNSGLDLILACLRVSNNGTKNEKIDSIRRHVPLDVKLQGPTGMERVIQLPRCTAVTNFKEDLFNLKYRIEVDGVPLTTCLGHSNLEDGSIITIVDRFPAPQDSSC